MDLQVRKVNTLLSVFQASLLSHLITVASNRNSGDTYLGHIPAIQIDELISEENNPDSHSESQFIEEPQSSQMLEEVPDIRSVPIYLHKHGKVLKKTSTVKNDLSGWLEKCKGKRKNATEVKTLELEFEEIGRVQKKSNYSAAPKVLQRLQSAENKPKPARHIVPEEPPQELPQASLYGEVIATTYSQGGDGFVLRPGDFVSVLQFLHEFGLVECKWQGMKGLFPQDKVKLLTRPSESLNSSLSSLVSKQFLNLRSGTSQSMSFTKNSKLANRLAKKSFD